MPRCFGMSVSRHTPQYSQRGTSPQILEAQRSHTLNKAVHIMPSWEETETPLARVERPTCMSTENMAGEKVNRGYIRKTNKSEICHI